MYFELTTFFDEVTWFKLLGLVSGLINLFFFVIVLRNKTLQAHPMRLFMFITLFESLALLHMYPSLNMCAFRLPDLFSLTVFYSASYYHLYRSISILWNAAYIIRFTSFYMALNLTTCLCLDLILMIRKPFADKESRVNKYLAACFIPTASIVTLSSFVDWEHIGGIIIFALFGSMGAMFFVTAPLSMIYACVKLNQPGISGEARTLVLKRHIYTILFFALANSYLFLGITVPILCEINDVYYVQENSWFLYILKLIYQSQGLFLPFLRVSEPYFYQIAIRKLKTTFMPCLRRRRTQLDEEMRDDLSFLDRGLGRIAFTVKDQLETTAGSLDPPGNWEVTEKEALQLEPLFLFLSSSLNVELVYIILKSITQFTYINSKNIENDDYMR